MLLVLFVNSKSDAQAYFNRLFTNQATGSQFLSLCPQNNQGNFMIAAMSNDSSAKTQGIRISRMDSSGSIFASSFFNIPDYPVRTLFLSQGGFTRIHNNCFALCGIVSKSACCQYGFVLLSDSNGNVYQYKDLTIPFSPSYDSFMWVAQVKYDGTNIMVLSHYSIAKGSAKQVLTKLDTALNLLWSKAYDLGSYPTNAGFDLLADSTGYVVSGTSDNRLNNFKAYRSEALVFRTDTSGNLKWYYKSPLMMGIAADIIRCADGGYVFSTQGNVYDKIAGSGTTGADWRAQEILVKLDSNGHWQWEQIYEPKYANFEMTTIRLLSLPHKDFMTMRITSDSPGLSTNILYANIRRYNDSGRLLMNHKYQEPIDTPVNNGNCALNDIILTDNNSIVMAGYLTNLNATAISPIQRGWIVKLDSNGCMGDTDPQCKPTNIYPFISSQNSFAVFPNPSNGNITIMQSIVPNGTVNVAIYDILGRVVCQQRLDFINQEANIKLNVSNGSYIVELQNEKGNRQFKRIVIN
ncbi:MAG: T9SS type A sorting domain-containing protein [Phycisphaerales bacterium]|nr:T9SS type A sorting domain-containing protein [Phycisphaerales bacterium]